MSQPAPKAIDPNSDLKERVRAFWQAHPCGTKFSDAEMGTPEFFERVEAHRYAKEWHIPEAADFGGARGLKVLEIGCGLGTDGARFAKAGALYTGIDLTEAAIGLARTRFEISGLPGEFRVADAENLDFADASFDRVYSHGVLHHTPDTARAIREIHRVLKPGGRLVTTAASGEQTTDERVRAAYFIVEPSRTQLSEIARLIDGGALRPVVGVVFPLAEARQAYQHKPSHGKVVLRVVDGEVGT